MEKLFAAPLCLRNTRRAVVQGGSELGQASGCRPARAAVMGERALGRLLPVGESPLHPASDEAHVSPGAPERSVVTELLEDRNRRLGELEQRVCTRLRLTEQVGVGQLDPRPKLDAAVTHRRGGVDCLGEGRLRALEVAQPPLRDPELAEKLGSVVASRPARVLRLGPED